MMNFVLKIKNFFIKNKKLSLLFLLIPVYGILVLGQRGGLKKDAISVVTQTPRQAAIAAKEKCLGMKEIESKRSECFADFHYELALQTNPDFAFKSLFELQKIDGKAKSCHLILHSIGRAAFDKDPKGWKESLRSMPEECDYGGLHGILEGYQSAGGIVDGKTIPTLCGEDEDGGCIHAVGHLILVEEKNNLSRALDLCGSYGQKQDTHHCMAGVFMESMIPRNLVLHGFVSEKRLINWWQNIYEFEELCKAYQTDAAVACWQEISHAAARIYRGDSQSVFRFCDSGPSQEAANACRRHIILDLVGVSQFDLKRIMGMCKLAPAYDTTFEKDCYNEMVSVASGNIEKESLREIADFCGLPPVEYRQGCYDSFYKALVSRRDLKTREKEEVCLWVPKEYQTSCERQEN